MLNGFLATLYTDGVTPLNFAIVAALSLLLGFVISRCHRAAVGEKGSMTTALIFLPFLVQIVILLVNGNLGTGVAVAGTFGLVRFRSAPGTARDITTIFLAVVVGIACGMGYAVLAVAAAAVVCVILLLQRKLPTHADNGDRNLKITIPENLDYADLFTDLFETYTERHTLQEVKTANMGSLYNLHFTVRLKDTAKEKEFIDELRVRNGNLEISCGRTGLVKEGKEIL
ncbi:MAG: DUF4956 domain-containing protein [Oscillospiraceae bacterium]|nr:DUF4956 domain-containing protein [Oscillospiraceae bacterium]